MCPRQAAGHPHNQIPIKEGGKLPKKSTKRQQKRSITCKQRDNADGARTVFSVQTQSGIGIYYRRAQRGVMRRVKQFCADMWRENKPGFFILSIMFLALFWSIGYYVYSVVGPGKFVVTIEKISENEALDILTKAILKEYCLQFRAECQDQKTKEIESSIRTVLPRLLEPTTPGYGYAKITYNNGTKEPITATHFKYRQQSGPWKIGNSKNFYQPKINRLRLARRLTGEGLTFRDKVDFALTAAVITNAVPFTMEPKARRLWRLVNVSANSEFLIEYTQNGRQYSTPVLRPR